jgi:hypothetical protein
VCCSICTKIMIQHHKKVRFAENPLPSNSTTNVANPKSILKVRSSEQEKERIYQRIAEKQSAVKRIMGNTRWNRIKITTWLQNDSTWRESEYAFVWVSENQENLCWKSGLLSFYSPTCIRLEEVQSIELGLPSGHSCPKHQQQGRFWRAVPELPWLCCTLTLENGIQVSLQFQDENQLEQWFWGLYELIDTPRRISQQELQEEMIDLKFEHMQRKFSTFRNTALIQS